MPFDVADTHSILGFNPVARNARVMTYQVVTLMESIRKCWGQGSFQETPRLARRLFNVAYALIAADVTFVQAQNMGNAGPDRVRLWRGIARDKGSASGDSLADGV